MNNTPTALIFFARPDVLQITFDAIKKAQPSQLFLIQDGPRLHHEQDLINIQKCRDIVSHIDWECEVFQNYATTNMGCGLRVYSGIKWAFEHTDRLLVIEDDCVPHLSLFPFATDLLERYKDDTRISIICGMNNLGVYDAVESDYFFSTSGSIWGWATWKRVWDAVDYEMGFMNNDYATPLVFKTDTKLERMGKNLVQQLRSNKKLSSWSYQLGMSMYLNNQLNIVPKRNMIANIGITMNSANSTDDMKYIPKAQRVLYNMTTYDVSFPLQHPQYVVNDLVFKRKLDRLMGDGFPLVRLYRQLETIYYRILEGQLGYLFTKIKQRIFKNA